VEGPERVRVGGWIHVRLRPVPEDVGDGHPTLKLTAWI
jgi:hypothetical protein